MADKILEINQLKVKFTKQQQSIVNGIDLYVKKGEVVGLVGESGAGKTITILSILKLLNKDSSLEMTGEITIYRDDDKLSILSLKSKELRKLRKHNVGFIFQEPMTALNPLMTCGKQVMEVISDDDKNIFYRFLSSLLFFTEKTIGRIFNKSINLTQKGSHHEMKERVLDWFNKMKIENPKIAFNKYPHELSGGQKQRVVIAMALIKEPKLLLADEPTTALDKFTQKSIIDDLKQLQKENQLAILFVSHDLELIRSIADRVYIMKNGSLVENGINKTIFNSPKHLYTRDLLASSPPIDKKLKELPTRRHFLGFDEEGYLGDVQLSIDQVVDMLTISKDTAIKNSKKLMTQNAIMEIKDVSISFKTKKGKENKSAVKKLSFNIFPGETLGIIGESGSGKTTIAKCILALIKPKNGEILFKKRNIFTMNRRDIKNFRKCVQIVFQDPYSSLNPNQTIYQTIAEPLIVHKIAVWNNNSQSITNKKKAVSENIDQNISNLLRQVGLVPDVKNKLPKELSGGQRQRVCIARALAVQPDIIVFDESVSALDVSVQADVLNLLNKLKAEHQLTYVFISHDLSIIRFISDRIMVMKDGELVEIGISEELFSTPKEKYSKDLLFSD